MKDGQGMDDKEERMKNKKYRSIKMFPSDIILKFKNIVKLNLNKLLKLKMYSVYNMLINFCKSKKFFIV